MKRNKHEDDISFLGKVLLFFKTQKEKLHDLHFSGRSSQKSEESDKQGEFAEVKLSKAFTVAKKASLSALCILIVIVLVFGSSIMSYENIYYMFKDISYVSTFNESRPSTLSYSQPFSKQDFVTFKDGLAVVGDGEIKFFTSTGRTTLTLGSNYTNPKICSSNDYVLIYDQGRNSFSIYNSFVSLFSETLDFPISYADMAPDGSFCIVTKSADYGSVVLIYNNKFKLESQYSKNDYVLSAEMSDNGDNIVVLSLDAQGGNSRASITVLKRGATKPLHTEVLTDVLPYKATFVSNDRIALICSDNASAYDLRGNRKNNFVYPYELLFAEKGNGCYGFVFNKNGVGTDNFVTYFDDNGNLKYSGMVSSRIYDAEILGKYIYLLQDDKVLRIDTTFGMTTSASVPVSDGKLVVFSDGNVAVCTTTTAYFVQFN